MENETNLDRDYDLFSAKRMEDIIIFRFKGNLLLRATDLRARAAILNYLVMFKSVRMGLRID